MAWLTSNTYYPRRVALLNAAKAAVTAIRALTSTTPTTTTDPDPVNGEAGVDTAGGWWSFFTANSATNYHRGVCRASGALTIAAGSTSGTITLGFSPAATDPIIIGTAQGVGGATITLPKWTLSGGTITVTVDNPTAGSVIIPWMVL